ncbi:hypothetical protein PMIN02_007197 [Paraphaeosphaeria minitans]
MQREVLKTGLPIPRVCPLIAAWKNHVLELVVSHRYLESCHLFTLRYVCIVSLSLNRNLSKVSEVPFAFDMNGFRAQFTIRVYVESGLHLCLLCHLPRGVAESPSKRIMPTVAFSTDVGPSISGSVPSVSPL